MKIRAQIGMVLNLDKCIGCHTCSVTCKNVWTSRPGMEYAWFNNVETKPGIGFPQEMGKPGTMERRLGAQGRWQACAQARAASWKILSQYLCQPQPAADRRLLRALHLRLRASAERPRNEHARPPRARVVRDHRQAHGQDRVGPQLGGRSWAANLPSAARTRYFEGMQKDMYGQFENTFMMYLPRLCEHCLNPACVASCPSAARSTSARKTASC